MKKLQAKRLCALAAAALLLLLTAVSAFPAFAEDSAVVYQFTAAAPAATKTSVVCIRL